MYYFNVMTGPSLPSLTIMHFLKEHPVFAINLFVLNVVILLFGLSYYISTKMHHKKIARLILMAFFSIIILIFVLIFYSLFYSLLV